MTRTPAPRVFRFAPSPNGYLHLGHAFSAVLNFEAAEAADGRFLLRIEDIDEMRCRQEFEQAIYDDLDWLGLSWEEPVRRQSEHFSDYAGALARLSAAGLIYPCYCTRGEIMEAIAGKSSWPRDPDGSPLYPQTCRSLTEAEKRRRSLASEPAALRIDIKAALAKAGRTLTWRETSASGGTREIAAKPALWGDAVLSRKDVPASYHLAVVVDDALQGVTDVVRGEDLFMATSLHRLLQDLLGLPVPDYCHHPLLRDGLGRKLSKSARSKPLRALRLDGISPEALRAYFPAQSAAMLKL
jgi:glutamyl-Q tRNA(Asp) synthetase